MKVLTCAIFFVLICFIKGDDDTEAHVKVIEEVKEIISKEVRT